jgi:hypothetical protein
VNFSRVSFLWLILISYILTTPSGDCPSFELLLCKNVQLAPSTNRKASLAIPPNFGSS